MKFKKSISLVLTLCMVFSLFATFVFPVAAEDEPTNVALGKTYTYPTEGIYTHWDSQWECSKYVETALTDGEKVAGYYGLGTTSGWGGASPNPLEVVIDLEDVYSMGSFAYTVCGGVDGISMPASVDIYVSEDGETFTLVDVTTIDGELDHPIDWTDCADRTSVATAAAAVEGRYVKFAFTKNGNFVFINELEVYGAEAKADDDKVAANLTTDIGIMYVGTTGTYEGVTTLITTAGTYSFSWDKAAVLEKVADGVYEVTAITPGDGTATDLTITEGQMIIAANGGNDWPALFETAKGDEWFIGGENGNGVPYSKCPNFSTEHVGAWFANVGAMTVGSYYKFVGIDPEAPVVDANYVVDFDTDPSYGYTNADYVTYSFLTATDYTPDDPAAELPEDATGLDVYGYTHTYLNYVMFADASMTLGELTEKYLGTSKDLNYFKVIVINEDGTVAATYLTLGREPAEGPNGVKTDIAVTAGQIVLALSANEANVGRHEIADTVNVGDIVTLYNVDFDAEPGELTNAGFTVEAAPALNKVDGGELPVFNPRAGENLEIPANTAIIYTVAFKDGAHFSLYDETVTVLVNGEALEPSEYGYETVLEKDDVLTVVNETAEAVVLYPAVVPVIMGTMSDPIVLDELGDITANVTMDIVMDGGAVHYMYTAPADGILTITMPEGNWTYTVNNLTAGVYGDSQWSDSDPVLSVCSIEVSEGDEIEIVVGTYDPEDPWSAPEDKVTFNAAFEETFVTGNVTVPEGWGTVDVLIDGYTGVGEITAHNGNHAALVPFKNANVDEDTAYSFIVSLAESTSFNTVTVYVLSHTGGNVGLPKTLSVTINGKTYEAAAVTGDDASVVAIVVDLGETVEADKITVNATIAAGAVKYNAYSEIEVSTVVTIPDVIDLKVSHNNRYNWGTFESMIVSKPGKTVTEVMDKTPYWWVMYVVENVDGVYVATEYYKDCDEINTTVCPEDGFLYYVYSANSAWDVAVDGKLLGYYFILNDIDLGTDMSIDTNAGNDPMIMTVVNPDALKAGDVNMNGKIDATDYATIRKLVIGAADPADFSDLALELADVNGNGKIDANDYILVKRHFLGTYTIPAWKDAE